MSELTKRVLFALAAAPIFIYLIITGGFYFWALMVLISLLTTWEIVNLFNHANFKTNLLLALGITSCWFSMPYHELGYYILSVFVFIILIKETLTPPHNRFLSILTTSFAGFYPAWGFYSFFQIRTYHSDEMGLYLLLLVVLMIWGNDTFAYFGGKNFGKHKMAPEISPAKTWEGFISGFLGSILILAVFLFYFESKFTINWPYLIPLAIIASVFGPIGDLLESKLKRFAGKKDSSNLLPGHGGFFDRFDSVILVSPAVILYLKILEKILG